MKKPARSSEAHGYFKTWLFLEALDDTFKADRRDLFARSPKVHQERDLGATGHRLLQLQAGSANSNVIKHSLDFRIVVGSIQ